MNSSTWRVILLKPLIYSIPRTPLNDWNGRVGVKISRILHAGYVFESGETQIAFDPIFENPFSRNCYAFPPVRFDIPQIQKLRWDAVFISHYHDDHCSLESLNHLDRETPIYIYCLFAELLDWIRELGFKKVFPLNLQVPVQIGHFEIIPLRALDEDVDSIFHIKSQGLNILNMVDSWMDLSTLDRLEKDVPWDLVLWPFQTLREMEVLAPSRASPTPPEIPSEWIEQLQKLNPRYVVPSSCQFIHEEWSWYNQALFPISYKYFAQEMARRLPAVEVMRLDPSMAVILDKKSLNKTSPLSWVQRLDNGTGDYEFNPHILPPSPAEVARRFPALSQEQFERVFHFCKTEILERYNSFSASEAGEDSSEDHYFSSPRLWELTVWNHMGEASTFSYHFEAGKMAGAREEKGPLAWCTEVSAFKLYAALEWGESLSSMYVRINDKIFSPEIETSLSNVDIVEDPLLASLFNGRFGSYQKFQLQRLSPLLTHPSVK